MIFPSSDVLESALSTLWTRYRKGKVKLSELVNDAGPFADVISNPERCGLIASVRRQLLTMAFSGFVMLSKEKNDDVWCIDPRGVLTLSVSKDTYERLGLVGKKLPFKTHADQHGTSFH